MSSDEYLSANLCFEELVENDSHSDDSEKYEPSTSQGKRKRIKKTTIAQFEKISTFMNSYEKKVLGKELFKELWDVLVSELNVLGPPTHTSDEWKNVWSRYKSKNLKKPKSSTSSKNEPLKLVDTSHPDAIHSDTSHHEYPTEQQHPSPSETVFEENAGQIITYEIISDEQSRQGFDYTNPKLPLMSCSDTNSDINTSKVVEKLEIMIAQNQKIDEKLEKIIALNETTNELLKTLLEKKS